MDRGKYNCVDYGHGGGTIKKIFRTVRRGGDEENVGSRREESISPPAASINNRIPPAPPPPIISKIRNPPPPPIISQQRDKEPLKRPQRDDDRDGHRPGPSHSRPYKRPRLESKDQRRDHQHHHHRSNHNPEPCRNNHKDKEFQVPLPDCPLPSTIDVMDSGSEASNSPNTDCLPSSPDDETDVFVVTDARITLPAKLANRSASIAQPAQKSKSHLAPAGTILAKLRGSKRIDNKNRNNNSRNGNNQRSDAPPSCGTRRSCNSPKLSTDSERSGADESNRRRGSEERRPRSNDEVRGGNKEKALSLSKSSQQSTVRTAPCVSKQNNPPGNNTASSKDCGTKGVDDARKILASVSTLKENLSQALLRRTAQAKAAADKALDSNKTTQQSETSSSCPSNWIRITPQASQGTAPTPSTIVSPAKASTTLVDKVSQVKSSPIPTEVATKVSPAKSSTTLVQKVSPTAAEKAGPPKASPTGAEKASTTAAEKASTTAAEKASTTAAEKAGPPKALPTSAEKAGPLKALPTAAEKAGPPKGSPTASEKASPAKSSPAPSASSKLTGPAEVSRTRKPSSSSESDILPKIQIVPLTSITRKIPPDPTKIPPGDPEAGAVLTQKTKTGSQQQSKSFSDELLARELESARAKFTSKEPAFASKDELLNTLLGGCDDELEENEAQITAVVSMTNTSPVTPQDPGSRENVEPGKDSSASAKETCSVKENPGRSAVVNATVVIPGLDQICSEQPNAAATVLNASSSVQNLSATSSVEHDDVSVAPTAPSSDMNGISSERPGPSNPSEGLAARHESVVTIEAERPCCEEITPELMDSEPEKIVNISPAASAKLKVNLMLTTQKDLALPVPAPAESLSVNQSDNQADETEATMDTENFGVSRLIVPPAEETEDICDSLPSPAQANQTIVNVNILAVSMQTVAEDSNEDDSVRVSEECQQDLTCESSGQDLIGNDIPGETQTTSVSISNETQTECVTISNEIQSEKVPINTETPTESVSISNETSTESVSISNETPTDSVSISNEIQSQSGSIPNENQTEKNVLDVSVSAGDPPVNEQQRGSSIEDSRELSSEEEPVEPPSESINALSTIEDPQSCQDQAEMTPNEEQSHFQSSSTTTLEESEDPQDAQANECESVEGLVSSGYTVSNEEGPVAMNNSSGPAEDSTVAVEPTGTEIREAVREVGQLMTNLSDAPPVTETIPAPEPMEVEDSSGTPEEDGTVKDSEAADSPLLTPPASSEALPKVELNFSLPEDQGADDVFVVEDNELENDAENLGATSDNPLTENDSTASTSQAGETVVVESRSSIESYPILQILQHNSADVGIQTDLPDKTLRIRSDLFDPTTTFPDLPEIPVPEQITSAARKVKMDVFKSIATLCNKFSQVIEKAGGDSADEVQKLEEVLARMRVLTDRQYCHIDYLQIILSHLRRKAAGESSTTDVTTTMDPPESVDPIELITVEELSLYFQSLLLIDSIPQRKNSSLHELIYLQRYRICRLMFYFLRSNIAREEAYGMNICNLLYAKVKSGQEEISWTTENVVKCWDAVRLFSGEVDVKAIQLDHKRIGAKGFFKQANALVRKSKAENAADLEGQPQQQNLQQEQNLQQQQQQLNVQQNTGPLPQNTPPTISNLVGSHSPVTPSDMIDLEIIHVQGAPSPSQMVQQQVQYQPQAQQLLQQRQQQMTPNLQQQQHVQQQQQIHVQQQQQHGQQQQQIHVQQHVQQQQQHVQQQQQHGQQQQQIHVQQQQQQHVQQQQQQHVQQQQQIHVQQQHVQQQHVQQQHVQQQHVQQQHVQQQQHIQQQNQNNVLRNQLLNRHVLQRRGSNESNYQYPQNIQQQNGSVTQIRTSPGQQQQFPVRRQAPQMAQVQQQQMYPQYPQQQPQVRLQQQQVQLQQQQQVQMQQQQQVQLQQQNQQVQLQQQNQQVQLQQQNQQVQLQQVQYQQQQQLPTEQQILAQQLLQNQQLQQQMVSQQQQMVLTQQQQHHRQYQEQQRVTQMHRSTAGMIVRQPAHTMTNQVVQQSLHHQIAIRPQSSPTIDQQQLASQIIPDQMTPQSFSVQQQRPNSRGTPVLQSAQPYHAISSPVSPPVVAGQFNARRRTPGPSGLQQNFVAESNVVVPSTSAASSAIRVDIGSTTLYVPYSGNSNAVSNVVQNQRQQSTPPILQASAAGVQQRPSSNSGMGLVANNNNNNNVYEGRENPSVLPSIDGDLLFPFVD